MSSDPFFDAAVKATDGQLASISELMEQEDNLSRAIETQEALLSDLKQRVNQLRNSTLPLAMAAAGVDRFRCSETGTEARLTFECSGALGSNDEERERKLDLLVRAGADEIVKTEVTAAFGKQQLSVAQSLCGELQRRGLAVVMRRNIHPMTLKSWVKERIEAGDSLPLDEAGLWYGQVAKIKRPKES